MIKLFNALLRYYDVDIMDSFSYFTEESHESVDSFIGRRNSNIDSDNSGSNGSNSSNSRLTSNCADSCQEAQERRDKESLWNESDDYPDIPIIIVPGNERSNSGDSDKDLSSSDSDQSTTNSDPSSTDSDPSSTESDPTSTDSDPSRTHGPIDREEAKARICNTSQIKYWYDTIIALLNWGGDGGGGDSSPGIPYLGSVHNSVITMGMKLYSYIDSIPSGLLYTVIGYFLLFKLYRLYRFLYWELKTYEIDMRWMLPSFTSYRVPYETVKPLHRLMRLHRLKAWTLPPLFTDWVFSFHNYYGIYHLKQIRRALGLHFIRGNAITTCFHSISFADRGLRTLILRDFVATTVRVSTRILDPISCEYIYHYFYILIYMGVGAIVWYQTLPGGEGLITPCPTGFDFDIAPEFRDPTLIAPGYRKLCYLFTKDLTPTVINTYTNHVEFTDILSYLVEEDLSPTGVEGGQQRVIAVGTALMIAVLVTTKSLVIPA